MLDLRSVLGIKALTWGQSVEQKEEVRKSCYPDYEAKSLIAPLLSPEQQHCVCVYMC